MTRDVDYLVIGGGLAAAHGAMAARESDASASIVVVTEEPMLLYERPPLSKEYLRGEKSAEKLLVKQADYYRENKIEVLTSTRAESVDAGSRTVSLAGGDSLRYRGLLLATGASARRLDLPGSSLEGVHYLRSRTDSDALREAADAGKRAVIIGGGFIGAEVAASLTQLGTDVTIVMREDVIWSHVFGEQVGRFFHRFLESKGVRLLTTGVEEITGEGRVQKVRLASGENLDADLVVIGVGVDLNLDLARQAGCAIENGVTVGPTLETSVPGVFAAGDIARFPNPLAGGSQPETLRVEHWDVAISTGKTAGKNMTGARERYQAIPYFFSDLFDVAMEFTGHISGREHVEMLQGDLAEPPFAALYVEGGLVQGAVLVNNFDVTEKVREFMKGDRPRSELRL